MQIKPFAMQDQYMQRFDQTIYFIIPYIIQLLGQVNTVQVNKHDVYTNKMYTHVSAHNVACFIMLEMNLLFCKLPSTGKTQIHMA